MATPPGGLGRISCRAGGAYMNRLPVIAITMGDPAGVGPEVCLKAVCSPKVRRCCVPVIVGDLEVLRLHARKMRLPGRLEKVSGGALPERALAPSDPPPG